MLESDGSIHEFKQDKLNRQDFIERIIEGIIKYKDNDSLVIGLEGNWGSGKTSILNIIEKELEVKKIKIFKFNPWNFSIRKQLVSDFFEQFSLFLGSRSNLKEVLKDMSKNLMKISYILKPITTITGVVPIIGNVTKGVEELGKSYEKISNTIDLESIKKGIEQALEKGEEKIIIFIDDLDRLLDSEICEVLQLIKGIGDLKNIVYIIAYDKSIIINSLNKLTSNKGEEYLKKIIQIQIELPIMTSLKIGFLFKNEIESLFSDKILKMNECEIEYLCEVFEEILIYLPKTMRDLKKIMNNIRFGLKKSEDLNIIDFIFIKTLEVTNYNVYKYLKDNKNNLVISSRIELENIDLKKFNKKDKELLEKILKIIFEKKYNYFPSSKYIEKYNPKRICNDVYFYNYFGEELSLISIGKDVQNNLMLVKTEENFIDYLSEIDQLETITEVILNVSEFVFYKDYEKTLGIHLINLLEKYVISHDKKFDNRVILINKIKNILKKDNDYSLKINKNDEEIFDLNKLEFKSLMSVKIFMNIFHNENKINNLIKMYIKRNMNENTSILTYARDLSNNLKEHDEIYYLGVIYDIENGRELIIKNKEEILKIKDKIIESLNQQLTKSKNLIEIIEILEEE